MKHSIFIDDIPPCLLHYDSDINFISNRHIGQFPNIRREAQWMLTIPSAEACDERTFSSVGQVLGPRWTAQTPERVSFSSIKILKFPEMNNVFNYSVFNSLFYICFLNYFSGIFGSRARVGPLFKLIAFEFCSLTLSHLSFR